MWKSRTRRFFQLQCFRQNAFHGETVSFRGWKVSTLLLCLGKVWTPGLEGNQWRKRPSWSQHVSARENRRRVSCNGSVHESRGLASRQNICKAGHRWSAE